ncbi:carbohydrate binding domain-containing protein [Pseudomonas trivialis]|uniref:carbohydrate binding domain-containing protein n=1 Tax=Pseudomonas trivialis TaxID=200450 RepID=UPI0030CAF810
MTVVFRTTVDACCEDGPVITFPESTYTLRKYYRDLTDFNDKTFGRWERGPGAPDPRDLSFESLGVASDGTENYAVLNYTYTSKNLGVILHREFDDLESGTTYAFSASVRRYNTADPTPKLSLKVDNVAITSTAVLTDPNTWVTLSGTFVASSNFALLVLNSHERDPGAVGNDYLIDYLLVEEV